LDQQIELNMAISVRKEALPPALLKFVSAFNEPSAVAAMFPADALASVTGRVDVPAFLEILSGVVTADAWKTLGANVEQGLMPVLGKKFLALLPQHLGPDVGFCLMPPAAKQGVLPDLAIVVRVKPSADGKLERAVLDGCDTLATLFRVQYGARSDEPIRLETVRENGFEIKCLVHEKLFPPGVRPAYALRDGYLILASSPEAILRLDVASAGKPPSSGPNRLVSVSTRNWRQYLTSRRTDLMATLAAMTAAKPDEVAGQIDRLLMLFELFDRLDLVNESNQPGQMRLSLKLQTVQPLKN
jgi:hypothetical protein